MPSTVKKSLLGRSIEEVLVRRRAEDESVSLRGSLRGSSSLPTLVGPQSQSQSGLNRGNVGPGINGGSLAPSTFFHEQNVLLGKSKSQGETKPKEKDPLVESLVDYCKTLQNRINVRFCVHVQCSAYYYHIHFRVFLPSPHFKANIIYILNFTLSSNSHTGTRVPTASCERV